MAEFDLLCIRGPGEVVGRGLHRYVLRSGEVAIKVQLLRGKNASRVIEKALEADRRNRELRKRADFLPGYYGTVVTGIRRGEKAVPVVATFHEYVEPIRSFSLEILRDIFRLIARAGDMGYVLDMKPSNFGLKNGRVIYLDEYGVGRGPIPPDVLDDLVALVEEFVGRTRLRKTR